MAARATGRYAAAVREDAPTSCRGARHVRSITLGVALVVAGLALAQDPPKHIPGGVSVEIRGEVVELGCYLRDGARGEGHRACAMASLKNGGQPAIVQDQTGTLYPLAGATPASDPSPAARQHVAAHVLVRGQLFERNGGRALVVEELTRLGP